jgi:hypothetical protein
MSYEVECSCRFLAMNFSGGGETTWILLLVKRISFRIMMFHVSPFGRLMALSAIEGRTTSMAAVMCLQLQENRS